MCQNANTVEPETPAHNLDSSLLNEISIQLASALNISFSQNYLHFLEPFFTMTSKPAGDVLLDKCAYIFKMNAACFDRLLGNDIHIHRKKIAVGFTLRQCSL